LYANNSYPIDVRPYIPETLLTPPNAKFWKIHWSNVAGWSVTEKEAQGPLPRKAGLYSDNCFAETPEYLVMPLLIGPFCIISHAGLKSQSASDIWSKIL